MSYPSANGQATHHNHGTPSGVLRLSGARVRLALTTQPTGHERGINNHDSGEFSYQRHSAGAQSPRGLRSWLTKSLMIEAGIEAVLGISDSCAPDAMMRPPSITTIRSARSTVDSRCAMTSVVRPAAAVSSAD